MAQVTNTFIGGGMNKDLDERLIPEGFYRYALNIDIDSDSGSNVGTARNSLGNTLVADLSDVVSGFDPLTDNAKTIGSVKYETDNLMYWMVAADTFDGVFEYNEDTNVISRVLLCTKATPTTVSTLGFDKRYLITGVNYVNGFLYWTDNNMAPRKINIARSKSYTVDDSRIADDINVIIAPPLESPSIELTNDLTIQSNNLSEKFLSFSYRYKYIDGQYSAMSPFSASAFAPSAYELDYAAGNNKSMTNAFNSAIITFNTGGLNVKEIQLLMHDVRNNNVSVIESFNKEKLSIIDNIDYTFKFNNNKTYTVLEASQLNRLFDNVPLKAKAQDFVGNRLAYGNYTQFYNIKDCNGVDLKIDLGLSYSSEATANGTPIQTWRSDRDYEVGIEYLDSYGRHTTVLTSENNTTYIPATQSDKGNSLLVTVKNQAPCWATNYRLVVKQSKKAYYNVFPILFYADGAYRYFLINESDRDKVIVGKYLIFKSTASGVTYSNKKYKVLELELKNAGFVSGAGAGLYFKIKVDDSSELSASDVFQYSSTGIGGGRVITNIGGNRYPVHPLYNQQFQHIENPIHYGNGPDGIVSVVGNNFTVGSTVDYRVVIKIASPTTFDVLYYSIGSTTTSYSTVSTGNTITPGVNIPISINPIAFNVQFSTSSGLVVGDRYVINAKGYLYPYAQSVAIVPGTGWSSTSPETDRSIEAGAIITLQIAEDTWNPSVNTSVQSFPPSPRKYQNIEEWWWESGAKDLFNFYAPNGTNIKGSKVRFRRGKNWALESGTNTQFDSNRIETGGVINSETLKYPMRMLIESAMPVNNTDNDPYYTGIGNNNQNKLVVNFSIRQQDTPTICETEASDNDLDIYHETVSTFPISNGMHLTNTSDFPDNIDQTTTGGLISQALIKLNYPTNENSDYNAWAFGNGLESDRIKDDWNAPELQLSPRVNSAVEEYKQRRSENAICYSGIYGQNTGVNRLNEFNLSIANFKYLDKEFGSIQKMYARDTDLIVFQENKISQVLYGKNLMYDAVGGGTVVSIPEVLGTQNPYPGEWGISQNAESFAAYGNDIFFSDARRGSVLKMDPNGIVPISSIGMTDYFKDLMRDNPYTQKLGAYDPDKQLYVLATNDDSVRTCELSINRSALAVKKAAQATPMFMFSIETSVSWTLSKISTGSGTSWLTIESGTTGSGNADVMATFTENTSGVNRSMNISVNYCIGLKKTFTITQGRGPKGKLILMFKNNVVQ